MWLEIILLVLIILSIVLILIILKSQKSNNTTNTVIQPIKIPISTDTKFFGENIDLAKQLSSNVTSLLYPSNKYIKPNINSITVEYSDTIQNAGETTGGSDKLINLSKSWFNSHPDINELKGVLIHELTHCFQYNANMPSYLVEGIADYTRLYYNYIPTWWKKTKTDPYTQGYSTMAYFLQFIVTKYPTFVQDLNHESMLGYNDQIFIKLTGKSIDALFQEYNS